MNSRENLARPRVCPMTANTGSNPSGERGFAFSRAWRTIPESGISWGTANAGSNSTEEGEFAERGARGCLPRREGSPEER